MPKGSPITTNFSSGELSPFLDGRVDVSKYFNGVKELENFFILPTGGVKRRPGTYYIAEVEDSEKKSRLIPFQFSVDQAYVIELADRKLRFFANHGQLLSSGTAYEITSPWLEDDLYDIQFAQDADTMWLTHPSYRPRKLQRQGPSFDDYTGFLLHFDGTDGSTTFTEESGKIMTAHGTAQIDTAEYKFGGASGLFDGDSDYLTTPDHAFFNFGTNDWTVDGWFRFAGLPPATNYMTLFAQYENANSYFYFDLRAQSGKYILYFRNSIGGGWGSDQSFDLSLNTWYHFAWVRSGNKMYFFKDGVLLNSEPFTTAMPDITGLVYVGYDGTGSSDYFNGWMDEFRVCNGIARWTSSFTPETSPYVGDVVTFSLVNYGPGLLTLDVAPGGAGWAVGDTITGNTSGVTCEILEVVDNTHYKIKDKSQGAYTDGEVLTNGVDAADQGAGFPTHTLDPFSDDGGDDCPSCVSIHEQRLCFANTNNDPQKLWMSVSGVFDDMEMGAEDDDALAYTIGSEQVNEIKWLSSGRVLGMGTFGGVFSASSGSDQTPITPSNIVIKRETSYGAIGIIPKKIGNYVYYVQRNAKTMREFVYSYDIDEYTAFDITILAEHITGSGIVVMDYQQSPYNMLWCVREDGEMAVLTRQIEQEVLAWTRVTTNGEFESIAVIPEEGGDDEVWVTVKRNINGSDKRYVEYFKPMDFGDEQEDAFFVDCGLTLDNPIVITNITQDNPGVVVTQGEHPFTAGDIVIIRGVVGMTEVNNTRFTVGGTDTNAFELKDEDGVNLDTTGYTAYDSGGEVRECVTTVSGLDHLEDEEVAVLVDGVEGDSDTVSSGAISITTPANGGGEIHAGLAYESSIKTMRLEAASAQETAQSKLKRINKVFIMINESQGMCIGNEDVQDEVVFSEDELFTGWKDITFPSLWDRNGYVIITQDKPLPLNILSIVYYLISSDA